MAETLTYLYDANEHPEDKSQILRWMKIAAVINLLLALFSCYCFFQAQQTPRLIISLVFLAGSVIFGLISAGILPIVYRLPRGHHYVRIASEQLEYRFAAYAKIKTISLADVKAVGITPDAITFFYSGNKQCSLPSRFIYNAEKKLELERLLTSRYPATKKAGAEKV